MIGIKQVLSSESDICQGVIQMTALGFDGKIWHGWRKPYVDVKRRGMTYELEWNWKVDVEGIKD